MADMEYENRLRVWMRENLDRLGRGSRTELAHRLGRSRSAISRMLGGKAAIAHGDVLVMEQLFRTVAPRPEDRQADGLIETAAAWSGADGALEVFHRSLRRLDGPQQKFLLDCSTFVARRLRRWRFVDRD